MKILKENMLRFGTKNLQEQQAVPSSTKTFAHDDMQKRVYDALNAKGIVTEIPTGNTDIKDVESGMGTVQVGDYTHVAYIDLKKYDAALGIGTKSNWGADNSGVTFDPIKLLKKPILIAKNGWNNALPSDNKTMIPIGSIKSHLIGAGVIESISYDTGDNAPRLRLQVSNQMTGNLDSIILLVDPATGKIAQERSGGPDFSKFHRADRTNVFAKKYKDFYALGLTNNEQGSGPRTNITPETRGVNHRMNTRTGKIQTNIK
jgi:hypothetical protein